MTAIDHGTEQWHAERATGIGGSDIPVLLGLSHYSSPFALWAEKRGLLPPEDDADDEQAERRLAGQLMEPAIATLFTRRTGLHVAGEQMMIRHPGIEYARATLDGLVVEAHNCDELDIDFALGTLQIKFDARNPFDTIPPAMVAQCRWEMGVAGLDRCWLAVMHNRNRFRVYEIAQDPDDWAHMVKVAGEFWQHVIDGTPPPIDGTDATADALAAIWPVEAPGVAVDADNELAEILTRRAAIKARIRGDETVVKELDNEIAHRLADAETVCIDGTPAWTYRAQERRTVDRTALEAEHPAIAAAYTKVSTYRVLRPITPKEKK